MVDGPESDRGRTCIPVVWVNGIPFHLNRAGERVHEPTEERRIDPNKDKDAWSTQVGGSHYTKLAIQPMQYSMANGLDALQHTVVKYVTRFRDKNGIEDLEKAKQTLDLLIAYEKGKTNATR
jgi:hypothetical protein